MHLDVVVWGYNYKLEIVHNVKSPVSIAENSINDGDFQVVPGILQDETRKDPGGILNNIPIMLVASLVS